MSNNSVQIMSPVGRMVQGHPMKMSDKGYQGKQLTDKNGNPREECFFAVAFPKTDPLIATIWQQIQQVAAAGFPGGQSSRQDFSWKIKDGDQAPYNTKEGFAGNYVFSFKSGYTPTIYERGGTVQITEARQLKCGDFVRVYFNVVANGDVGKPGVYLNPQIVELVGYGDEIKSGPSGDVFAQDPIAALPAGASATPTAGTPISTGATAPPSMPGAGPVGAITPPPMPGASSQPAVPSAGIQPSPDFLNAPPAPDQPMTAPEYVMTEKAGAYTREQYNKAGWTDERLLAEGYMIDKNDVPL